MNLALLPQDLLEQIFNYVLDDDIMALWDTGDQAMRSKMMNGAVKSLKVQELRYLRNYAPHFRLRKLDLAELRPQALSASDEALSFVNQNLKELILSAHLTNALIIANGSSSESMKSSSPPLSIFASLETLHLRFYVARAFNPTSLPQTLTRLTLKAMASHPTSLGVITPQLLKCLPSSITRLKCSPYATTFLTMDAFRLLADDRTILPNLVDFAVEATAAHSALLASDNIWPDYIVRLSLTFIFDYAPRPSIYPKHLTRLHLVDRSHLAQAAHTGNLFVKRLPPSLAVLKVTEIIWSQIDSSAVWPPSLTTLSLHHSEAHLPSYHLLPRSLLRFDSGYAEGRDISLHDADAAVAFGRNIINTIEKDKWNQCKRYLRSLDSRCYPRVSSHVDEYIEAVERGELRGLPLTLTALNCFQSTQYSNWTEIFPPHLTSLELLRPTFISSCKFWKLLPPHMTSLEAKCDRFFQWCPSWELDSLQPEESPLFQMTSLTRLRIPISSSASFKYLPRTLLILLFASKKVVGATPEELKQLPPSLHTLRAALNPTDPKRWLEHLPRTITKLTLRRTPTDGSDLARLPPKLKSLDIHRTRFLSLDRLLNIPKTIETITLEFEAEEDLPFLNTARFARLQVFFQPFSKFFKSSRETILNVINKI